MGQAKNLINQKFGRLFVLAKSDERRNKQVMWICKCDCGNIKKVRSFSLDSGNTKSCGCLNREKSVFNKGLEKAVKVNKKYTKEIALLRRNFSNYKSGASKRNLNFDLTFEEFQSLVTENCFYCEVPPSRALKISKKINYPEIFCNGIDRINNDLGYFLENCVSCCIDCNRAKSNMTPKDFVTWIWRFQEVSKIEEPSN